jgi:hypothetical protein
MIAMCPIMLPKPKQSKRGTGGLKMTEFEKGYEQGYKDGMAGAALPNVIDNGDKIDGYDYAYKTDSNGEPYIHIDSVRSMLKELKIENKEQKRYPVKEWNRRNEIMEERNYMVIVSLGDFVKYTLGEIYYLAPNHNPRCIDEIRKAIISRFMDGCEHIGKYFFYHEVALKDLYKFISDILMPIEKFRELNLSQREFENGIKVDDENRAKFVFTDMYTSIPEYDDFIDLDACMQNIFSRFELEEFRTRRNDEIEVAELLRFRNAYRQDKEGKK